MQPPTLLAGACCDQPTHAWMSPGLAALLDRFSLVPRHQAFGGLGENDPRRKHREAISCCASLFVMDCRFAHSACVGCAVCGLGAGLSSEQAEIDAETSKTAARRAMVRFMISVVVGGPGSVNGMLLPLPAGSEEAARSVEHMRTVRIKARGPW